MKREDFLKIAYFAFCILVLLGSQQVYAAEYRLDGTDVHKERYSYGDGEWGGWQHCQEYSGANSVPKSFSAYVLNDSPKEFKYALLDCRQMKATGVLSESSTSSQKFFTAPGSGESTKTKTATSLTKLPVGLNVTFGGNGSSEGHLSEYLFRVWLTVLSPSDIAAAKSEGVMATKSGYAGNIDGFDSDIKPPSYWDPVVIECDAGYVMTGMRLKTLDADEGKYITGAEIKCTKLVKK